MTDSLSHPCNYEGILDEETEQARRIAFYLQHRPTPGRILDVGCGPGNYVAELRKAGLEAYGIDIDPRCEQAAHCRRLDVTTYRGPFTPFPFVLSLEVGEHIPEEKSWAYVAFIAACEPEAVLFSAARPGQGGDGHINCQPKSYWAHRFERLGYVYEPIVTAGFKAYLGCGYHLGWLMQNVMFFHRSP